jgi:hypothetical protein
MIISAIILLMYFAWTLIGCTISKLKLIEMRSIGNYDLNWRSMDENCPIYSRAVKIVRSRSYCKKVFFCVIYIYNKKCDAPTCLELHRSWFEHTTGHLSFICRLWKILDLRSWFLHDLDLTWSHLFNFYLHRKMQVIGLLMFPSFVWCFVELCSTLQY